MERADAVLLVLDASTGIVSQDQHVASYALEAGRGLVIVVNKIDLVEPALRTEKAWRELVRHEFRFAAHVPLLTVSAKTGQNLGKLLPIALEVVGQRRIRIPTSELNSMLHEAIERRPPPSYRGRRLHLKFATQASSETPTVVLFVNDVGLLHFSYRRYLENQLRQRFGFAGNPLRIVLRPAKEDPAEPRRSRAAPRPR
jgi:GTP-binding protein